MKFVYRLNINDGKAFFNAQRFAMVNGDIVYMSTAPLEEWRKVLRLFQLVTQPVASGMTLSNGLSSGGNNSNNNP